jgi:hypothetical protein
MGGIRRPSLSDDRLRLPQRFEREGLDPEEVVIARL